MTNDLMQQIRENRIRLDSCKRHLFDPNDEVKAGAKLICQSCKGKIDMLDAAEYIKGFKAAGGDPCLVWENWHTEADKDQTVCPSCHWRKAKVNDCELCNQTGGVSYEQARAYFEKLDS